MIGRMPPARPGAPGAPTRRAALGALALLAAAGPLAACGIRLEDDAPRVPLVPTREPVPGEAFVLELWLGSRDLADLAGRVGGSPASLPSRLVAVHREQATVLRTLLRQMGVPDSAVERAEAAHGAAASATTTTTAASSAGASPSATPTASTTTPPPTPASLAAAEAAPLTTDSLAALAVLPASAVPVTATALAQRAASAVLLGRSVPWPEQPGLAPSVAAGALDSVRAAAYAFEGVAAQSADAQRTQASAPLASLRGRATRLAAAAGDAAAPPALGHPLPFRVTTAGTARRLAVHALTGLRAAHAADLPAAAGDAAALASLVQWLAEAEVLAYRWRVPPAPFPGLA
jgi:hypothetical protein